MFSAGLMLRVSSDYVAMRVLYQLEPLTTASSIVVLMLDVVEKSLKLHLSVQTKTKKALSEMSTLYGHNIESLRSECAKFSPIFNDADVRAFTKDLNDRDGKLYQQLRYGAQQTTAGFSTSLDKLLPVVDKVFVRSILLLPEDSRRMLLSGSPVRLLLGRSNLDQTQNPELVLALLKRGNAHFDDLLCHSTEIERELTEAAIKLAEAQRGHRGGDEEGGSGDA
jgi:hypothetical protein